MAGDLDALPVGGTDSTVHLLFRTVAKLAASSAATACTHPPAAPSPPPGIREPSRPCST
ncbi:hypothetical protein [Streptomyces sp. NRRL B-24484]|uniref:hypothetical protein n=1 Tax=Streptomyces sp. NRRL B-24484 TaxID=1463833 RepID=UPI000B1E3263|nr:hypothetical protein [Streptomyces sp. NRRL B-24484]